MATKQEIRDVKIVSIVAWLLSIPVLAMGIWLATSKPNLNFLQWPLISMGVPLFLLPFLGFFMLHQEDQRRSIFWIFRPRDPNPWKWPFFLVLVSNLLALLFAFTVFAFTTGGGGGGDAVPHKAFLEFYLSNFSPWLQGRVSKDGAWDRIKNTLILSKPCHSLPQLYDAFNLAKLSPVQAKKEVKKMEKKS